MNLDDLLAEVDTIGGDRYIPSTQSRAQVETVVPAEENAAVSDALSPIGPAPLQQPIHTSTHAALGSIDMVLDLEFEVTVELGRIRIPLNTLLSLAQGDRFIVDQHPDEPLKLFVDNQLIGRGEALIIDNQLAIRIVELLHQPLVKS